LSNDYAGALALIFSQSVETNAK